MGKNPYSAIDPLHDLWKNHDDRLRSIEELVHHDDVHRHYVGDAGHLFTTGWQNSSNFSAPAYYFLDPFGEVRFSGIVSRTSGASSVIFVVHHMPEQDLVKPVSTNINGVPVTGHLRISATTGEVTLLSGNTNDVCLDAISYHIMIS